MKLTFELGGKSYFFDGSSLSVAETRLMKMHLGLGPSEAAQWEQMILTADVDAIILVMLIARRRAGEKVEWADFDDLDAQVVLEAFLDGMKRAVAEQDQPAAANRQARRQPAK